MRGNKGQSPIQYATVILVIVALVGSWMAYSAAGQGATESQVNKALEDTATTSDLDKAATDIMDAIKGKKVTETEVADFLSGKDWSSAKSILERAGIEVPKAGPKSRFEGIEIVYMAGAKGDPYSTRLLNGVTAAAKDLGVNLTTMFSGWDPEKMVSNFKKAVAMKPDGISVMGHPGPEALKPFIKEAEKKGIVVTSHDTQLPPLEEKYRGKGFGYVGIEPRPAGLALGHKLVSKYDLGSGDKALVCGLKAQPVRGQRGAAVEEVLKEAGVKVDWYEIPSDVNKDPSKFVSIFTAYMGDHPDTNVLVTDHGGMTSMQSEYADAAGLKPDEIIGAGFDLTPGSVKGLEDGFTDVVLDSQPYLDGYLPVLQICLAHKYGFSGLHINAGTGVVTSEDIAAIKPLIEKGIR